MEVSCTRKKFSPPTPTDLLDLSPDDYNDVIKLPTAKGPQVKYKNNMFIAYSIDVNDHQTIRKAYLKIRMLHAKARHVVCAYFLPGKQKQYCMDYADDEDHGMGRIILREMVKCNIINKAFFVVRYSWEKLQQDRALAYIEAVTALQKISPNNSIVGHKQILTEKNKESNMERDRRQAITPNHPGEVDNEPPKTPKERRTYTHRDSVRGRGGGKKNTESYAKPPPSKR